MLYRLKLITNHQESARPFTLAGQVKVCLTAFALSLLLAGCSVAVKPVPEQKYADFGQTRLSRVAVNEEPLSGPINLYEAMARALKYNLDVKVEAVEQALKIQELKVTNYTMLPDLVAESGYAGRNNTDASTVTTRDPDVLTSDLTFSWNILDFGLSYIRAKQAADEVLVQIETKRKVLNRLIEDVRTAYWRAASYQKLVSKMRALEKRVLMALKESRQISGDGENSPLLALTYERELIEMQSNIEALESEMLAAKTQLAALMNIRPETEYTLVPLKPTNAKPALPDNLSSLYAMAVANRPEMRELVYQLRINDQELNAAILRLLPNFNIYAGLNYDSNEFIEPNDWISWGGKITWNLLKAVNLPNTRRAINMQGEALEARALSVSMAIMTQVQISRIRYAHLSKRYRTTTALASVTNRILGQIKAEAQSDRATQQNLIREEMNSLLAEARNDMAYADLQTALANLYSSVGLDPFPLSLNVDNISIETIARSLEESWKQRSKPVKLKSK